MVAVMVFVLCGCNDVVRLLWLYCSVAVRMLFVLYGCSVVVSVVWL